MNTHTLTLLAVTLAGCESGITSDAQPIVSVLVQDGSCFALMAGDAIDPVLGVSGTCPYRADTRLLADIDLVEVVVDYGPDVPFSGTTVAPPPDITLTIDGVESDMPIMVSSEYRVAERGYFIATFRAPPQTSTDVRISARVNAGFQTVVPEVLTTVAPQVEIALLECPEGGTCPVFGATGSVHVHLAVPGTVPQFVTIHSTIGGVPQPAPVPPVKTFVTSGRTVTTTAIPVPVAPDNTPWVISAQLGSGPITSVNAMIHAPLIVSELTCGASCMALDEGDPVGLVIVTDADIRPLEAYVTSRLDGIPLIVGARVPLEPRADGTALGLLGMTVPGPGTWQVDVTVAGYDAPAIVTTVQ
jgi:hypothetical protein